MSDRIEAELVAVLRQMATERCSVADMVRAILPGRHPVDVYLHFREAFGLSFGEAKPITDWLAYGGSDADLNDVVWPRIELHRPAWVIPPSEK